MLGALLVCLTLSAQEPPAQDAFLVLGIRQYGDGDYEAALFTLDSAVRKLTGSPGRVRELVRAYVYLGATYVGLDHEDVAKGKFREALTLDPTVRLSPDEFAPRVLQVFETQVLKATVAQRKRGGKVVLLLGAVGAAGAVGVAVATKESAPPNRPPTVTIGVAPEGDPLTGVTVLNFTASAADPDGDTLNHAWEFGDGGTATGSTVAHRFDSSGSFTVSVTVTDGRGGTVTARRMVNARALTGTWRNSGLGGGDRRTYQCVQTGPSFDCQTPRLEQCGGDNPVPGCELPPNYCCFADRWSGTLADPRSVVVNFELRSGQRYACNGEVSSDLQQVRCVNPAGQPHQFSRQ